MRNLTLIVSALALVATSPATAQQKWADVTGQIIFGGKEVPKKEEVEVTKDREHCLSKGALHAQNWIVDPQTKGVANAVIWLRPVESKERIPELPSDVIKPELAKPSPKPAVMDQPCCHFEPHVVAMQAGQTFLVKNSAPIPHNVNLAVSPRSGMSGFNQILPPKTEKSVSDVKAWYTPMNIRCDIHPWMQAYAWVFPHPYYAVTDGKGNFTLKDAPVGKYNMVVWHEAVGYLGGAPGMFGQTIEIKEDGTTLEPITLSPRE